MISDTIEPVLADTTDNPNVIVDSVVTHNFDDVIENADKSPSKLSTLLSGMRRRIFVVPGKIVLIGYSLLRILMTTTSISLLWLLSNSFRSTYISEYNFESEYFDLSTNANECRLNFFAKFTSPSLPPQKYESEKIK